MSEYVCKEKGEEEEVLRRRMDNGLSSLVAVSEKNKRYVKKEKEEINGHDC